MIATSWYLSLVSHTFKPKASLLRSGSWTDAYHRTILETVSKVALQVIGDSVKVETLRFDIPDALPIQGDPNTLNLLMGVAEKLTLKFDQQGKIVPRLPL